MTPVITVMPENQIVRRDSVQFNLTSRCSDGHLEECAIPVDAVETHETLCWWNIDESSLICEHNVSSAMTSGYQNNLFNSSYLAMLPWPRFSSHKLITGTSILTALITNELIGLGELNDRAAR
jgi:hypothetical protein